MKASVMNRLFAIGSSVNKSTIGILATASTVVRVLDASSANTRRLAVVAATSQFSYTRNYMIRESLPPEERPVIRIGSQLARRGSLALVGLTSTVRSTVVLVILVVDLEDSKGLLAGYTGVVGTLSSLDGIGGL